MYWIFENAEKLGGLATVGAMIAALCALVFALIQILEARSSQREATAKDIYRDYLKLAFDNPEFANPAEGGWKDKGEWIKDEKYRWFVTFMLNSCDEISRSKPRDKTWRKVIQTEFDLHKDYLKSREFNEDDKGWCLYSPKLKKIWAQMTEIAPKPHMRRICWNRPR
jgi:hypothetical protein